MIFENRVFADAKKAEATLGEGGPNAMAGVLVRTREGRKMQGRGPGGHRGRDGRDAVLSQGIAGNRQKLRQVRKDPPRNFRGGLGPADTWISDSWSPKRRE